MKQGFFKDSLIARLGRNEMTFESFLTDAEVFVSIKRNNKVVTSFALDYIDKLLDYAVFGSEECSDSANLSYRAMKIITANNCKIVYAISGGTKITSLARKILKNHEELIENGCDSNTTNEFNWSCIIGKFSTILETCFNKYPENISNFHFLLNFLRFADNIMLSSFFKTVVSSKREEVKSYLRLIKFPNEIMDIITEWHNGNDSPFSTEGILSLYSVFIKYINNIANDGCLSPSLIQFALEFLPTSDRNIIAKQWKLANEVIDTTNACDFATLYPDALIAIKSCNDISIDTNLEREISYFPPNRSLFYKYQENALEFLSSLFSCYPSFVTEIDGKVLVQALANIYDEFSFSSIALSAVCTLMLILIDINDIQETVIDNFIPIIVEKIRYDIDNDSKVESSETSDSKEEDDDKFELSNSERSYVPDISDDNDSIINNDDNDSIVNDDDPVVKNNRKETEESMVSENEDRSRNMSVNQRAFTLEFAKQVMEMCMSNDELKDQLSEQQDFLEVCIPKVLKASSFITNDYGGMCILPNMVRYSNMDPLKPINLNVSVNI